MWKLAIQILENTNRILKQLSTIINTLKELMEVMNNEN